MTPGVSQTTVKTVPNTSAKPVAGRTTTSYTGPITRARAKKKAQIQLLETVPEDLLSESEDEAYDILEELQTTLIEDDSEFEEVDTELPDSDTEINEA